MMGTGGGSDEENSNRPLIDMFEDGSDLRHRMICLGQVVTRCLNQNVAVAD